MPDSFKEILKLVNIKAYDIISDIQDTEEYLNISLGNIQLREEVYNVRDMMEEIRLNAEIRAKEFEGEYRIEIDSSVPQWLFGDKGRIGMLISKQLEYGCRFSKDCIWIKMSAEPVRLRCDGLCSSDQRENCDSGTCLRTDASLSGTGTECFGKFMLP